MITLAALPWIPWNCCFKKKNTERAGARGQGPGFPQSRTCRQLSCLSLKLEQQQGQPRHAFFPPNFFQILKSQHPTAKIHWGPSVSVICTVCQNHSHHYHPTAVLSASQGLTEQLKTCKQFQNGEYLPQIANSTHTISHLTTPGGLTLQCLNQLDQQAHERGERNSSPLAAPLCEIHWQMEHFKIKSTAKAQKQRLFCFPFTWQPYLRFLFFFNSH